jgi:hypothetical protein
MLSDDPDDWLVGWDDYLYKLREKDPDYRRKEVEAFRLKAEAERERRREARNARLAGPLSEAHWFYEKGVRLRQEGRPDEARAVWQQLVAAFADVPAERAWVELAREELSDHPRNLERTGDARWAPVQEALARASALEAAGQQADARKIIEALRALYAHDPSARPVLEGRR